MERLVAKLLKVRVLVVVVFFLAAALGLLMTTGVRINYNMAVYLPEKAPSTVALDVMYDSYDEAVPNLRVMVKDVTIPQALEYKARLGEVLGVDSVSWLDDEVDVKIPLAMHSRKTVESWYADNCAVYSVVVDEDYRLSALTGIREIIGEEGAMSGNPVDTLNAQNTSSSEVSRMMLIIIPMCFVILMFTNTSWFEPVLFLVNAGVGIAINLGTNLFLGEISFVTQATAAILQLACAMDYSIFLLDRFAEIRAEGHPPDRAMAGAVTLSVSSISASGLTTVVGFAALMAMQFRIGGDMGFVLAKGIAFGLLSTLVFMPCLTLCCYKLIDKTTHRSFLPGFGGLAKVSDKIKGVVTLLVALLIVPCYLAQHNISYLYGMSGLAMPGSQIYEDRAAINDAFGESASFALLAPIGSLADEMALCQELGSLPAVSGVQSYVESVGNTIPAEFVPPKQLSRLNSAEYTRIAITAGIPPESEETFDFVETLRETAERYYPGCYHLVGETVNVYDMRETIQADSVKVNLISIGGIFLILLFTFRSLSLPFLLLITIEASIFINVAIPYFMGQTLNYIGYLIISSVQLGATVDYAILFANRYLENRAKMPAGTAVRQTIQDTASSILTSAGILTIAGLVLGLVSTNALISQLGILLARGTVLSALLVLVFLPAMLKWLEPVIRRTTLGLTFYTPEPPETTPKEELPC